MRQGAMAVSDVYKGGFFKNRHRLSWRAPIVGAALINTYGLVAGDSVVDVGCAIGDHVDWLNKNGIVSWGIEGSDAVKDFLVTDQISIWDLRFPLNIGLSDRKYTLAFSLEVAEHIDSLYAERYIDNLISLSDTILISAAKPGQKGHGHVNCASRHYWIDKFYKKGFINNPEDEKRWQKYLKPWATKKELSSYYKNVICFRRL